MNRLGHVMDYISSTDFKDRIAAGDAETRRKWNLYCERRRARDLVYRAILSYRSRVNSAIFKRHANVSGVLRTTDTLQRLCGCSRDDLRNHLAGQFKPGMTWENHSRDGWHIDHIRPLFLYDFTDPAQFAVAWNFTNLQPLWAVENRAKGVLELRRTISERHRVPR